MSKKKIKINKLQKKKIYPYTALSPLLKKKKKGPTHTPKLWLLTRAISLQVVSGFWQQSCWPRVCYLRTLRIATNWNIISTHNTAGKKNGHYL